MDRILSTYSYGICLFSMEVLQDFLKKEKIRKLSEKTRQIDDFFCKLEFVQARVYDIFVALDEL